MTTPPTDRSVDSSGHVVGQVEVGLVPYYADEAVTLYQGDAWTVLRSLPAGSVDCIVTSPPYYGLRDYGADDQIGMEASPQEYVNALCETFQPARRALADDGTLWLNLGDSYSGSWGNQSRNESSPGMVPATDGRFPSGTRTGAIRPGQPPAKNMLGVPWRVAFALQDDGWTLRNAVVWHKPNAMPSSVDDRLSNKYELIFLFSKSPRYHFDLDAIREPLAFPEALDQGIRFGGNKADGYGNPTYSGRTYRKRDQGGRQDGFTQGTGVSGYTHPNGKNPGDVWSITTKPYPEAHFATFPIDLPARCIKAGCKPGGVVLDPFSGSGTTGAAATKLGRRYVGIDLNAEYLDLSLRTRLAQTALIGGEAS